ncbi:hypothetical protein ACL2XO_24515 [Sodalis sp. RH15]|uniref:hypothetical protein n=1 Tax=Sodalis sp. RH15 TaxID=3394330 RepID=UPI0039B3B82B
MTTISATANAIGAALRKVGDILDPSPLASRMKGIGNVTARAASSLVPPAKSAPMAKSDARRVSRGAVGKEVPGQTRSTRSAGVKGIVRSSSVDDSDIHDDMAKAADELTASAMGQKSPPRTPVHLDEFKNDFDQACLHSLFDAAGKNKDALVTLFGKCENKAALPRLRRIATAYHVAVMARPSNDAMSEINGVMAKLTTMMVKDGLGQKSSFGSYRPGGKDDFKKVKGLETDLMAGLAKLVGEGTFAAGNFLRTKGAEPFIRTYVEKKLGILLTPEQSKTIDELLDSRAKATWENVLQGIKEHKTDEIEKVCLAIDMVLKLPNLLGPLIEDRVKEKRPSETATLEQQPKPKPLTTETDEDEINPATVLSGSEQDKTNGPPKPASIYNINNSYDFSTHITHNPINININQGEEKPDSKKPHTERADASTQTDWIPVQIQEKYEIGVWPKPMFAEVEEKPVEQILSAKMLSKLKTISIVEPPLQVAEHISPRQVEAPLSTVIHSQPLTAQAPQYAAPLSKAQDVPLSGINHTMADDKRFAEITRSPISRAQVHNLPPSDNDQRVIKDEDASWTHEQTRSHALEETQPVVLTNQGRQLSQLPRVEPKVKHFAPSNMKKEDLTAVRNRLKRTGMDTLSPPLEALKRQADGGAETRARAQQLSRADVAQTMARDMPAPQAIPAAETKAVPPSKPLDTSPIEPPISQPTEAYEPVVLSASGLRRPNRTHGTSGVKHFVPMGETPEVLPTLANGKTNYTSKRLAAYKPGANDIKEDGKS